MPYPLLIPLIAAGASIAGSLLQNRSNKRNLERQLAYNHPAAQRDRYASAGLNPNLVYSQGNPGNQAAPLQSDYSGVSNAGTAFSQARLTDSQVDATNAKTEQSRSATQVNKLQAKVLERNPLLNDTGFEAIIDGLKYTAESKKETAFLQNATAGNQSLKLQKEVALLEQRFDLGNLDKKIKAEVLTSMGFRNAILDVQKRFMTDAEITPQHIFQFITMLLMKIF